MSLTESIHAVADVNRIAAVIQAVVREKDSGIIYGPSPFSTRHCRWLNHRNSDAGLLRRAVPLLLFFYTAASDSRKNGIAAGY